MFRLNNKVKILSSKKTDGRFNFGKVVGVELLQDGAYLGYSSEKEFMARFKEPKYKVAYIDCVTKQACCGWFYSNEVEKP